MHRGFIKIWRKFKDSDLWRERRKFSRAEAWLDLILSANGLDGKQAIGMHTVKVSRGSMLISLRYLAERWAWSKGKTDRFLRWLKNETRIDLKTGHGWTHLTILNYSTYNPQRDTNGDASGTPDGTPTAHQRPTNGPPTGQTKRTEGSERTERAKKIPPKKKGPTISLPLFWEEFWEIYPEKKAKQEGIRAWNARLKEGITPQALIASLRIYIEDIKLRDKEEYVMNPATFINGRWQEFIPGKYVAQKKERKENPDAGKLVSFPGRSVTEEAADEAKYLASRKKVGKPVKRPGAGKGNEKPATKKESKAMMKDFKALLRKP